MSIAVTCEQLALLAPTSCAAYRDAFANGQAVLARHGITTTSMRVAHFLAQVLHESGAFTLQHENLRYSPRRLRMIWPHRFRPLGPLKAADYAWQPEKLANAVYGGRMGTDKRGDGYLYRGRGLLQLTGKDGYARATMLLQRSLPHAPDLVREPELVVSAQWCLEVAAAEWAARGCNQAADQDDIARVTFLISGGAVGLAQRIMWTAKTRVLYQAR